MSFSEAGGIITQTGTDTNLSGLSGISGVTVYNNIYILNNVFLRVEGSLSFNGMDERIVFVSGDDSGTGLNFMSIYVHDGASLTITCDRGVQFAGFVERTVFAPVVDFGTRLISATSGSTTDYDTGRKFISSHPNSAVNLSGVFVAENSEASGIMSALTGNTTLTDFKFITKAKANQNHQYSFEGVVTLTNVELIGGSLVDRGGTYTFDGFTSGECNFGFLFGGAVVSDKSVTVSNLSTYNVANFDVSINMAGTNSQGVVFLKNSEKSSNETTYAFIDDDGFSAVVFQSEITFNFVDIEGFPADASVFARDTNNGARNGTIIVPDGTDINTNSNRIYSGSTVAGTISFEPYTAFVTKISGIPNIDNRGDSNSSNLVFTYYAYGYVISQATPELIGLGSKTANITLLPDFSITAPDRTTVDAYPITVNLVGIELTLTGNGATLQTLTTEQFYDLCAVYLEDNLSGQSQTFVARSGRILDARALDVTLDYITFDPDDLIETSGTVTLTNGSTASFFDSTQDSSLSEINGSFIRVYGSEADRDARVNAIFEGTRYNFLFSTVPSNPVHLWVTQGNTELPSTTPITLVQGENIVDFGTAGVLASQGDTLVSINTQLGYINRQIFIDTTLVTDGDGSNERPFNNLTSAIALSVTTGIRVFAVASNAPLVIDQTIQGFSFVGNGYFVDLNNQDISACGFRGAVVEGEGNISAPSGYVRFVDCILGFNSAGASSCTLPAGLFNDCLLQNVTLNTNDIYGFIDCASNVAGGGAPTFDLGLGISILEVYFRRWSGGLNVSNVEAGDTMSIDGTSGGTITINGTGGLVDIRGVFKSVVDNSGGSVDVISTAVINRTGLATESKQDIILTDISSLNDPSLTEIVDGVWDEPLTGANHNDPTSAGRRLRQASAWLSVEGQVIGTPTTTTVQTDIAQTTSSFYADQLFVFTSGALAGQARIIVSYDGTTKTFTFDEPLTFAPSATDEFAVFANHIHPLSQIKAEVDQSLIDYDGPTKAELDAAEANIISEIDANEVKIDLIETKAQADTRQTALIAEHDATQSAIAGITGINETQFHAYLDSYTNKGNWQADISGLATQLSVNNLNDLSTSDIDARLTAYGSPTLTEMTAAFTEIKGAGWTTTDTLEAIRDAITTSGTSPADIWSYVSRTLTAGTKDAEIDAILEDTSITIPSLINDISPEYVQEIIGVISQDENVSGIIEDEKNINAILEDEELL